MVLIPGLCILISAFRPTLSSGGMGDGWTLVSFREVFSGAMLGIWWRTLWVSGLTSLICLVVAFPVAWFITKVQVKFRLWFLLLIIVPFWTNFLIRIFAWNQILHSDGWLARWLRCMGCLSSDDSLLFHTSTVVWVSVYTYLPFAILPLYAATENFDFYLLEAARDLGASRLRAIWCVFIPGVKKGVVTAWMIVFIPMLGSYVIPDLVGGTDGQMLGNRMTQRYFSDRNLPAASAMASVLTLMVVLPMFSARLKTGRLKKSPVETAN